jgi:predicted RNA-binding protein YlxR (DUF448 family)
LTRTQKENTEQEQIQIISQFPSSYAQEAVHHSNLEASTEIDTDQSSNLTQTNDQEDLLDDVGQSAKKPQRSCIACRQKFDSHQLLRFVLDPTGQLWVDIFRKAPGRGANLCFKQKCVQLAIKKKAFSHAFKQNLLHPTIEDLYIQIIAAIDRKLFDLIALAGRRRTVISGLNLLESLAPKLKLLICTTDCALSSKEQIKKKINCDMVEFSDSQTLGHLLGKEKRVMLGFEELDTANHLKSLLTYRSEILAKPSF